MILTRYRVEGKVRTRYIRKVAGQVFYKWCEQSLDDPRYDVAQGTCEASDIPDDIRKKCDEYNGTMYACEWPIN